MDNYKNVDIDTLYKIVILGDDSYLSCKFASEYEGTIENRKIEKLQEIVISSDNPRWCYLFSHIDGADIERLQEVIINSKEANWCYRLACFVEGVDIQRLQEVVMTSRNVDLCYRYGCYVRGANLKELKKTILEYGSVAQIIEYENSVVDWP